MQVSIAGNVKFCQGVVKGMRAKAIDKVREIEKITLKLEQVKIRTEHHLHAGLYARHIVIPAGVLLTGALIKIPTLLITNGEVVLYLGDKETRRLVGYNTLRTGANRKAAFLAVTDTDLTMIFATKAETVEEAENEFTDEAHMLASRQHPMEA